MPTASQTPSLSQALSWSSSHLTDAALHWSTTAATWEDAFTSVSSQMSRPGGSSWEGKAADSAQLRAYNDRLTVIRLADQLHDASSVARAGAAGISAAKQRVVDAVKAAQSAGFVVGEDYTVTSRGPTSVGQMAARQVQAQALAADIRLSVAELIAADQQVAAKISTATAAISSTQFHESELAEADRSAIQAFDNRTIAEAPPLPEPPAPPPGPLPPVNGEEDVRRSLDPLQNGGKRGANGVGTRPGVKEVWDTSSVKQLWDYLTRNGSDAEPRSGYKGITKALPDGTEIGLRQSGKGWDDTIDVWYPDGTNDKVHTPYAPYFPTIGDPPHFPPMADPAPIPNPQTGHAPVSLPPSGVFDPNGLPPWLQHPSTPGFNTTVEAPTIMPGVAIPDPSTMFETAPAEAGLLPNLGEDLAQAGKIAGAGVLAGFAIIGGLVVSGVSPGGQAVP